MFRKLLLLGFIEVGTIVRIEERCGVVLSQVGVEKDVEEGELIEERANRQWGFFRRRTNQGRVSLALSKVPSRVSLPRKP